MSIQHDTDEEGKLHSSTIHSLADQYHLDEIMMLVYMKVTAED